MMLLTCEQSYLDRVKKVVQDSLGKLRRTERQALERRGELHIINEAAIGCGDNVGGAAVAQSAPDGMTDDGSSGCDDGGGAGSGSDGDGDDDPDPDRRRTTTRCTRKRSSSGTFARSGAPVPDALTNFSLLPDDAHVRLPVVCGLYACSPATAWRRTKAGTIPTPVKLSDRVTAWRVGDLRAALAQLRA